MECPRWNPVHLNSTLSLDAEVATCIEAEPPSISLLTENADVVSFLLLRRMPVLVNHFCSLTPAWLT